jgi:hypothetical protein
MPSEVVQTIDELFPHAKKGVGDGTLAAAHSSQLRGIINLLKDVPSELINLPPLHYADLVLATSAIEEHLEIWISRGNVGGMAPVKGRDAVTVIRHVLALCPDDYPPPSTTELLFIKDDDARESIRSDVGATYRALNNNEWKAATVLGGAAIEALLHWRLAQPNPTPTEILAAVSNLKMAANFNAPSSQDDWVLYQFIAVGEELKLIKPDTAKATDLARSFRNLIHPGVGVRKNQLCDKATAHSAIAALEHVIRDLSS